MLLTTFQALYIVMSRHTTAAGVKRLNLGGKALTNLLKETVSYRSLDMRDEGLLMEQLKEQLCWVSQVCGSQALHGEQARSCLYKYTRTPALAV